MTRLLDFARVPRTIPEFVATVRLPKSAAREVLDFVHGFRADLPAWAAPIAVLLETWRGQTLGKIAALRDVVPMDIPKAELARVSVAYGKSGLPALAFRNGYTNSLAMKEATRHG